MLYIVHLLYSTLYVCTVYYVYMYVRMYCKVWEEIIGCCVPNDLSVAVDGLLMVWLCLSASPSSCPVDNTLLTRPTQV